MNDTYLSHHGVKGMKWGVRKDRQRNPNYTDKQRQRDRQFYGKGGERRINKKLNQGQGIQSARNYESDRLHRARNKAQSSASLGRIVGGVAGGVAGYNALKIADVGSRYLARKTKNTQVQKILLTRIKMDPQTQQAVQVGSAAVGAALGRGLGAKAGTKASMNIRGYSSKKARNSTSASGTRDTREAADTAVRLLLSR